MNELQILKRNPRKVLESLKQGEVESIELAVDQITDDFMIYGLRGGLIDELSSSFPDPRREEEITAKQILSASIAGHFQERIKEDFMSSFLHWKWRMSWTHFDGP